MHLALIHRSPASGGLPADAVVWRTCLREIAFLADAGSAYDRPRDAVTDAEAYALLVEIVSGLRSPLIGETEVQAQFKSFLATLDQVQHRSLLKLGQTVLRDAKRIRHQHLQGFGAHSYGRLAARHVPPGSRVVLVGTGALALEVIEALEEARRIDQWGRTDRRQHEVSPRALTFRLLADAAARPFHSSDPATLVIAAPADAVAIRDVATCYAALDVVIDLRPAGERTPLQLAPSVTLVTLDDLFDEASHEDTLGAKRLGAARADILALGRAYARQEELHPFGWDDVCA